MVTSTSGYDGGGQRFDVDVGPDQAIHQRGGETVTYGGAQNHCGIGASAIAQPVGAHRTAGMACPARREILPILDTW
jgi:hypothetical protein